MVTINLKQYKDVYFLHSIYPFTRLSKVSSLVVISLKWFKIVCERNHCHRCLCSENDGRSQNGTNHCSCLRSSMQNTMKNHLWYSPIQIVLSNHPKFTISYRESTSSLTRSRNDTVIKHRNVLHAEELRQKQNHLTESKRHSTIM